MFKRLLTYVLLLSAFALQAAQYTPASVPNPKQVGHGNYVANPDEIISDSAAVFLNRCAAMLEQATEVEMAVVALENIGETDAFDFAYELFQRWGIGGEGKNTGVLILFVLDSHDIRIMTGVGIEGVLPDATCSRIIHENMIPAFRQGDYSGGLCLGALRIYEVCTDGEAPEELQNMRSVTDRAGYAGQSETDAEFWFTLIAVIVILALFIWIGSKKGGGKNNRGHSGGGAGPIIFTTGGGGSSFGGGSFGGSWGGGSTMGGGAGGKW